MKVTTINVTQDDIRNGIPGDSENCAIACAIDRTLGIAAHVRTGSIHLGLEVIDTPPEAAAFIRRFDTRDDATPITIVLRPEEPDGGPGWELIRAAEPVSRLSQSLGIILAKPDRERTVLALLMPELFPSPEAEITVDDIEIITGHEMQRSPRCP